MSTEHNMTTLLAEKMFTNCNTTILRQHTVNKYFFCVVLFSTAYYIVIQPYLLHNVLYVKNDLRVNP